MHRLLYVSSTPQDFPHDELQSILRQSRDNNHRRDVTGLLLYIDGGFLQVLEGDRTALHDLYALIAKDTRHWDAKVLLDEEAPRNLVGGAWAFARCGRRRPNQVSRASPKKPFEDSSGQVGLSASSKS